MTQQITQQTKQMATTAMRQATPWRKGISWWVVMVEGLVSLGIGIYILWQGAAAGQIVQLLGIYMLVISVQLTIRGFRDSIPPQVMAERMLRAGIGLTVGAIIVLDMWQGYMTEVAPVVILSLGWLFIGVIGIAEWASARKELGWGMGALISPVAALLFGLLMLASRLTLGEMLLQSLGILSTVGGVALLGYAFMLNRKAARSAAA